MLAIFFLDVPVEDRFRLASIMFAFFSIPIFVFVKEPGERVTITGSELVRSFGQIFETIEHARGVLNQTAR